MPGYQGHRIGRSLMEASIQALIRRKYESLSLTVTAVNTSAVQLYEHLGFRNVKNIRSRRVAGVTNSNYFFARSFSRPFSSSMNSFTSLKSR